MELGFLILFYPDCYWNRLDVSCYLDLFGSVPLGIKKGSIRVDVRGTLLLGMPGAESTTTTLSSVSSSEACGSFQPWRIFPLFYSYLNWSFMVQNTFTAHGSKGWSETGATRTFGDHLAVLCKDCKEQNWT